MREDGEAGRTGRMGGRGAEGGAEMQNCKNHLNLSLQCFCSWRAGVASIAEDCIINRKSAAPCSKTISNNFIASINKIIIINE